MATCGFPRTRSNVINTVKNIIKEDNRPNPFKNGKSGKKWYSLFTQSFNEKYVVSPALRKYLYAPKALDFRTKIKSKENKMPLAISSETWRQYIKEKDDKKENIVKQREERKKKESKRIKQREKEKKLEKRIKIKPKKTKVVKKRLLKDSNRETDLAYLLSQETNLEKEKILCAGCEEELIRDIEEDEDKNIGCDICPKWFHLKCTVHRGRNYIDVAKEDFTCHQCLVHLIKLKTL